MTATALVVAFGGVSALMAIRVWALMASPSWVAKRTARGKVPRDALDKATLQRRLRIYYIAFGVFIVGWSVYAIVLRQRAIEWNHTSDGAMRR
jgi:hypothetical protein